MSSGMGRGMRDSCRDLREATRRENTAAEESADMTPLQSFWEFTDTDV